MDRQTSSRPGRPVRGCRPAPTPWQALSHSLLSGILALDQLLGLLAQRLEGWTHHVEPEAVERIALALPLLLLDPLAGLAERLPRLLLLPEPVLDHGEQEPVGCIELAVPGLHL